MTSGKLPVLLSLMLAPLSAQPEYDLQSFNVDGLSTIAKGINNRGAIVGTVYRDFSSYGFKRQANGRVEYPIATEISSDSLSLSGLNSYGDMVGHYSVAHHGLSATYAFKIIGGPQGVVVAVQDGDSDPFPRRFAHGINNLGDVVGSSSNMGGFAILDDNLTYLEFPGASQTTPYDIAWDRTIVGCIDTSSQPRAFLRGPAGNYVELKIPGAVSSCAYGINNAAGKIVGYYVDSAEKIHGFVYDYRADFGSDMVSRVPVVTVAVQTVDLPDMKSTRVEGINSESVIVGWSERMTGGYVSFTGRPIPAR